MLLGCLSKFFGISPKDFFTRLHPSFFVRFLRELLLIILVQFFPRFLAMILLTEIVPSFGVFHLGSLQSSCRCFPVFRQIFLAEFFRNPQEIYSLIFDIFINIPSLFPPGIPFRISSRIFSQIIPDIASGITSGLFLGFLPEFHQGFLTRFN